MTAVGRALRRKLGRYRQVWLADAAGCGLVLLIIGAATGQVLAGLTGAIIAVIARGAIESLWLGRRGDARAAPRSTPVPQPGPRARPAAPRARPAAPQRRPPPARQREDAGRGRR